MPLYHRDQQGNSQVLDITNPHPVRALLQTKFAVTLTKTGEIWYKNEHDRVGAQAITSEEYIPPFQVRALTLCDASETIRNIKYDQPGTADLHKISNKIRYQVDIVDTLNTNCIHPIHVTKVHLGAETTATKIILRG